MNKKKTWLVIAPIAIVLLVATIGLFFFSARTTFAFAENMPEKITVNKILNVTKYIDNPKGEYLTITAEYEKDGKTQEYSMMNSSFTPKNLGEVKITAAVEGTRKKVETTVEVLDTAPVVEAISEINYFHHETMVFKDLLKYIQYQSLSDVEITLDKYEYRDKMVRLDGKTEFTFEELGEYVFYGSLKNAGGSIPLMLRIDVAVELTENEKDDLTNTIYRTNFGTLDYTTEDHVEGSDWAWVLTADPTTTEANSYDEEGNRINSNHWWNRYSIDLGMEVDPAKYYWTMDVKMNENVGQLRFEFMDANNQVFGLMDFHQDGNTDWFQVSSETITEGNYATTLRVSVFHPDKGKVNFETYDVNNVQVMVDNCKLHERTEAELAAMKNEEYDFTNAVQKLEGGGNIKRTTEHAKNSAWAQQLGAGWWCTEDSGVFYRNIFHIDLGKTVDLSKSYFTMDVKLSKDAGQFRYDLLDKDGNSLKTVDMDNTTTGWTKISSKDEAIVGQATTLKITLMHPAKGAANYKGYDPYNVIAIIDNGAWHKRDAAEVAEIAAQVTAEEKDLTNKIYKDGGGITINGKVKDASKNSYWAQKITAAFWHVNASSSSHVTIDFGKEVDFKKTYFNIDVKLTKDVGDIVCTLLDSNDKKVGDYVVTSETDKWVTLSSQDLIFEGKAVKLRVTLRHPIEGAKEYDPNNVRAIIDNCYLYERSAEEIAAMDREVNDLSNSIYKDGGGISLNGRVKDTSKDSYWAQQITAAWWHTNDSGLLNSSYAYVDLGKEVDLSKEYVTVDVKLSEDAGDVVVNVLDENNTRLDTQWITSDKKGEWITFSTKDVATEGTAVRLKIALRHPYDANATYDAKNVKAIVDNCYVHARSAEELAATAEKSDLSNSVYKNGGGITINGKYTDDHATNSHWAQKVTAAHWHINASSSSYAYIDLQDGIDLSKKYVSVDIKLSGDAGDVVVNVLDANGAKINSGWITTSTKDSWVTLSSKDNATTGTAAKLQIAVRHPVGDGTGYDVNNVTALIDNCYIYERTPEELAAMQENKDLSNQVYKAENDGFGTLIGKSEDHADNSYWSQAFAADPAAVKGSEQYNNNYVYINLGEGIDLSRYYVSIDVKLTTDTEDFILTLLDADNKRLETGWITTAEKDGWVTLTSQDAAKTGTAMKLQLKVRHPYTDGATHNVDNVKVLIDNCYVYERSADEMAVLVESKDLSNGFYKKGLVTVIGKSEEHATNGYWSQEIKAHPDTKYENSGFYNNNYGYIDLGEGVDLSRQYITLDIKLSEDAGDVIFTVLDENESRLESGWITTSEKGTWVTLSSKDKATSGIAKYVKITLRHPAVTGSNHNVDNVKAWLDNCYVHDR